MEFHGFSMVLVTKEMELCIKLIRDIYSYHGAGGGLHIILDDGNIDDDNLDFCRIYLDSSDHGDSWEHKFMECKCLLSLYLLNKSQRKNVILFAKGDGVS